MVKANELAFFSLPENLFYEVVFFFIPGFEIVFYESAGVTGICIEAPECVMQMLLCDELSEVFHPLQIVAFHEAAPLAYEDWSYVVFCDIEPVIVPGVLIEGFVSKTALKQLFKKNTGSGVCDYFIKLKIERAKTYIRENNYNFTQIAEMLGYNSVHYFSAQFKKIVAMSPTEYAASIRALTSEAERF